MTKSFRFKGTIKSSGIVNFDGKDAKWILKKAKEDCGKQLSFNNVKVAKHAITKDKDGNLSAVLKISRDCIRQGIFKEDQPFHNPGIVHNQKTFNSFISSVAGLIRGYMFADVGIKRKSPFYISDAVQISSNVSTFDVGTLSAPKEQKENADDSSGLTLHYKETIGGIVTYEFEGAIDLSELQFISLSELYDRKAVDQNYLGEYTTGLEKVLDSKVSSKKFYIKNTATNGLPEEGILLTSNQVKFLVKELFQRLFDLEILRGSSGRAWLDTMQIMSKSNGLETNEPITVSNTNDIINMIGEIEASYTEFSEEEAKKLYESMDNGRKKVTAAKNDKKTAKEKKTSKSEE